MPTTKPFPPATPVSHWGLWPGFTPGAWNGAVPGAYLILTQATVGALPITPYVDTPWNWAVYPAGWLYPGSTTFPGRGAIQIAPAGLADPASPVPDLLAPDAPPAGLSLVAAGAGVSTVTPDSPVSLTLSAVPATPISLPADVHGSSILTPVSSTSKPLTPAAYLPGTYPGAPTYPGSSTYPGHTPQIVLTPEYLVA